MDAELTFNDGLLRFRVRNTETGEETPHAIDVLLLRLTCEECETVHSLPVGDDGRYVVKGQVAIAFLTDLAARIAAIGLPQCDTSLAYQLWRASLTEIDNLKKNTSETPSSPSGSESSPSQPSEPSAVSDSATPTESPPSSELGSGQT